jgi:hypothetical protein
MEFHEPWQGGDTNNGFFNPLAVKYVCPQCGFNCDDSTDLAAHKFQDHGLRRPALLLGGQEVLSPNQLITRPLREEEISVINADTCQVNGTDLQIQDLPEFLAQQRKGFYTVAVSQAGISSQYALTVELPIDDELREIGRLFLAIVGKDKLDIERINTLIDAAEKFTSARRYLDGLSQYLYGVLAKDQRGGIQLSQAEYKTKFNLALENLKLYNTPLAQDIVGVVNFSQNVFDGVTELAYAPRLYAALQRFQGFMEGNIVEIGLPMEEPAGMANVPLDHATDQLLSWAITPFEELHEHARQLESAALDPTWTPDDRFKVVMLLAQMYTSFGEKELARGHARRAVNDALFGDWARRIMEMNG